MARIRLYQPTDASGLERCIIALQSFERQIEPNRVAGEQIALQYHQHLLARCEQTDGAIIVAEEGGAVVGFVAVFSHMDSESLIEAIADYAYISDLVVLPAYRGCGLGRTLLQHAEGYAKARGAAVLKVDVLTANAAAHQLYRAMGFEDHEVRLIKALDSSA